MSLSAAILEESEALTITRYAVGSRDATSGLYIPGSTSTVDIRASLQPLSMRDVEALPEGMRQRASFKLYTSTALQIADPDTGGLGDQFAKNGEKYEVGSLHNWYTHGNFYKYVALRVEE